MTEEEGKELESVLDYTAEDLLVADANAKKAFNQIVNEKLEAPLTEWLTGVLKDMSFTITCNKEDEND